MKLWAFYILEMNSKSHTLESLHELCLTKETWHVAIFLTNGSAYFIWKMHNDVGHQTPTEIIMSNKIFRLNLVREIKSISMHIMQNYILYHLLVKQTSLTVWPGK